MNLNTNIQNKTQTSQSINDINQTFDHKKEKTTLEFKSTIFLFYKYIKYFRFHFWLSVIVSLITTIFGMLLILALGDMTVLLTQVVLQNNLQPGLNYDFISGSFFLIFGGFCIFGYFIYSFANWLLTTIVIRISQNVGFKLRMDLFNKIQMLSINYFDTHESGDIMSVLSNDVYNLVIFISQNLGQLLSGFSMMVGMMILMFIISPYISLIVLFTIGLCCALIGFIAKKSGPAFMKQQDELGRMNGFVEEIISGQNIINLFSQEKQSQEKFSLINAELSKQGQKSQSISGLLIPWLNFLMNFIIAIEIAISWTFVVQDIPFGSNISSISLVPWQLDKYNAEFERYLSEVLSLDQNQINELVMQSTKLGMVTSLMLATRNFINPINQVIAMFAQFQAAVAGSKRVVEIFEQKDEYNENESVVIEGNLKGNVEIKNLNFSYVENKPILKNINLSVKKGETVAIVGPTGSGKTTIINLLTKFYDIKDGDILLDEYSIKTLKKESVRNQVSIVLQDTYLFNVSIKENIRYAKPDATDDEIISVAKTAGCHDFIMTLDDKYDTILTENAQELSSGQKQLIAIARAMLSPSNILILDEATSNIDTRTEKIVQNAMQKLIKNKTSFVIAHRLSTIRNADKIVVLKDGEILEMGNHKQLMKQKGFYYNLNMSKTDDLDIDKD